MIMVPGEPGQKPFRDPIFMVKNLGVLLHACHPSSLRKLKIGGSQSRSDWAKRETLSPKK
jgi:hypothetical protein